MLGTLRLVIGAERAADLGAFVPVDPDPAEAVEDLADGVLDVPLLVGVVDPEDELAAVMPGQQPVEQGRPHPADVQETGRAGCESRAYTHEACFAAKPLEPCEFNSDIPFSPREQATIGYRGAGCQPLRRSGAEFPRSELSSAPPELWLATLVEVT